MSQAEEPRASLPREPIDRFTAPIAQFLHIEAASGGVLLVCAALALVMANSPWSEAWKGIWETPVGIGFGSFQMTHSLKHWINDGLMAVFFFVVGLEVKREIVLGELRDLRVATLPIVGALGGMVVPAGVYLWLQAGEPTASGWGIPMATDIAFVVGCLAVLGPRVPNSLRVMLLSLAIVDDIGAIVVIAVGYTKSLDLTALALGVLGILAVAALARLGVRSLAVYTAVGFGVWLETHQSGVHATLAGVILGLMTPTRPWVEQSRLRRYMDEAIRGHDAGVWDRRQGRAARLAELLTAAREAVSPLEYTEYKLHPWVGFAIMPVFALANAGVTLKIGYLSDPVAIAVAAGLLLGKPIGIVLFVFVGVRLGLTRLPAGVGWGAIAGGGILAGIGFTMALFIAGLALDGQPLYAAKVGILGASLLAAIAGMALLVASLPKPEREGGSA